MNTYKSSLRTSALILLLSASALTAVEIPLESNGSAAPQNGQQQAVSVGYVDMDKVFSQHPMTKRLKEDFLAEVDKRKREIAGLQAAADAFQQVIVSSQAELSQQRSTLNVLRLTLTSQTTGADPLISSGTAAVAPTASALAVSTQSFAAVDTLVAKENEIREKEAAIGVMQQDYEKQKQELAKRIRQNKEDLVAMEEKNTTLVLSDLYSIVQKMADEEGIGVIFDKNSLLCGQICQDLTQKVLDRLKGR